MEPGSPPRRRIVVRFAIAAFIIVGLSAVVFWFRDGLRDAFTQGPTPFPSLVAVTSPEGATFDPLPATFTPDPVVVPTTPIPLHSPTAGPSPTPTNTPRPTQTPTATSPPTETPTSLPQARPTLSVTGTGMLAEGIPTPPTAIPSPVPTYEASGAITNILLLGSDTPLGSEDSRTDTIIIASINHSGPTASMISLPRDLFVYIPGKTMGRLNTAARLGGVDLLEQTILYNFGIPIHYYARVDFEGYKEVVDTIGGVDINVSCRFHDWRLKSPELDPELEDNWEQFTLEPGIHHMDGDLALWYARSRLSSNDFHRGRRQQQLLRAMLNQGVDLGMIAQVPNLWNVFKDRIETDIDIGRLLQFATLAPSIRENGVQHLYLAGKTENWIVPESGANVQLPKWEGDGMMEETFRRLYLAPALSKATRPPMLVEIINLTANPDLAVLASDNLAWYGFQPIISSIEAHPELQEIATTQLRYYADNFKGSYDWLFSWIFHKRSSQIELVSDDPDFPYDYQVILAADYDPCIDQLYAPQPFLDQ